MNYFVTLISLLSIGRCFANPIAEPRSFGNYVKIPGNFTNAGIDTSHEASILPRQAPVWKLAQFSAPNCQGGAEVFFAGFPVSCSEYTSAGLGSFTWDNAGAYELTNFVAPFCGGPAQQNFGNSDGSECFSLNPGSSKATSFIVGG